MDVNASLVLWDGEGNMWSSIKRLNEFIRGDRTRYMIAVLAIAAVAVLGFIPPLLIRLTLDTLLGGKPVDQWNALWVPLMGGVEYLRGNLWVVALALLILTALQGVLNYIKGRWSAEASENVAKRLRERLYDHIQKLPYAYHVSTETGDLIQRCTSDLETIRRFLAVELVEVGRAVFMLVLALPIMVSLSPAMTLVSMAVIPPILAFSIIFFTKARKAFKKSDEAEGALSALLQENLSGIRVVKAFCRQNYEMGRFDERSSDFRDKTYRLIRMLALYWSSSDLLCMIQVGAVLGLGAFWAAQGKISVGVLVVFLTYVNSLLWPIRQMGRILTDMGKTIVSVTRIGEILDREAEPYEDESESLPDIQGEIAFEGVGFEYAPGKPVLKDISFNAKPGQTIAILGPTGSGKSTLINLLPRLYEYTGSIRIDGRELRDIPRRFLRRRIGVVLQEPFLFARTVGDNIGFGMEIVEPAQIEDAARIASLHDVVLDFEQGYETMVGEKGVTLSGGQKQRTAIARAVIKDAPIMIFDDALSAVDTETDARIRAALRKRKGRAVTFLISHRLSTLSQADLILVLEDGRITQSGTHAQLVIRDGLYQRIWNIQNALEKEVRDDMEDAAFTLAESVEESDTSQRPA
jgi:ATP-binding cassette, subfamily B, bacterial